MANNHLSKVSTFPEEKKHKKPFFPLISFVWEIRENWEKLDSEGVSQFTTKFKRGEKLSTEGALNFLSYHAEKENRMGFAFHTLMKWSKGVSTPRSPEKVEKYFDSLRKEWGLCSE